MPRVRRPGACRPAAVLIRQ